MLSANDVESVEDCAIIIDTCMDVVEGLKVIVAFKGYVHRTNLSKVRTFVTGLDII